eukprot:snap_masked-scaffold_1-processed-gene-0.11-mRNA-1 protein AED:1.00 eAED:1.00 QI:0/0/0/0/1/1/2/0/235
MTNVGSIEDELPGEEEEFPPEVLNCQEFLSQTFDDSFGNNLSELKANVAIGVIFDIVTKASVAESRLRRVVYSIICVWVGYKISRMSTQQNIPEVTKGSAYSLLRAIKTAGGSDLKNTSSLQQHDRTVLQALLLTGAAQTVSNPENHQQEIDGTPGDIEVSLPKSNLNITRLRGFLESLKQTQGIQDHLGTYNEFLLAVTQKINLRNLTNLPNTDIGKFDLVANFIINLKHLNIV